MPEWLLNIIYGDESSDVGYKPPPTPSQWWGDPTMGGPHPGSESDPSEWILPASENPHEEGTLPWFEWMSNYGGAPDVGSHPWHQWMGEGGYDIPETLGLQPVTSLIGTKPSDISPESLYSPWMQDFFSAEGSLPTLFQGAPSYGGADISPQQLYELWGLEAQGLPTPKEGAGVISSYPGFREGYEVLDFMIEGERVREKSETEQFKLDDLLEGIQTSDTGGLRVGGVSRELEDQRGTINQGLIDLDKKRELALSAQETELAQSVYDLRADYEKQAASDYLAWLSDYMPPESDAPTLCYVTCADGCQKAVECADEQAQGVYWGDMNCCASEDEDSDDDCNCYVDLEGRTWCYNQHGFACTP